MGGGKGEIKKNEEKKGKREVWEEYLLSLMLQGFNLTDRLPKSKKTDFTTPLARGVYEQLEKYLDKYKKFSISSFVKNLPEELVGAADRLYLADLGKVSQTEALLTKEIEKIQKRLRVDSLQGRLKILGQKVKEEEEKGESAQTLRRDFNRLVQKLKKLG